MDDDPLDDLQTGVLTLDRQGRVTYANARARALLGMGDDPLGHPLQMSDARAQDGRRIAAQDLPHERALRGGALPASELVDLDVGGEQRTLFIEVHAARPPSLDIVCELHDVSAAIKSRGDEALYRSVIRAMAEGVAIHEPDGTIRMANPAAERILGLTTDQMSGRSPLDPRWRLLRVDGTPLPPEEIPSEITRRTGIPCFGHELIVHRPTGERASLSVSTDPVGEWPHGQQPVVVATFTDVTAERVAQRELERSRAYLSVLLDAVPGVVYQFLLRRDGRFEIPFMSARCEEVLGIPAHETMSNPLALWQRVHPDDRKAMTDTINESAASSRLWELEFRVGRPEDGYRYVRARSMPEPDPDGVRWTGVLIDVTESHRRAEAMRHAQRRELMGELAAGIAHNFNNMLAAIVPNVELAIERADPEVRALLADAHDASRHAADLVQQLLAFARKEGQEQSTEVVDFGHIVRQVARVCRRTFDRRIVIEERVPTTPILVRGRASNVNQVVLNLCLNARDAMDRRESGLLRIELTVEAQRTGPSFAVLRVADTGSGMSRETLARIGEPFFTTKGPGRGTGLGLASIYGIVREAGGTIECSSELGVGTTFSVRLPVVAEVSVRPQRATAPDAAWLRGRRIAVVDDEPLVRQALKRMLERLGLEVLEAQDGPSGCQLADKHARELVAVLLDLSLPDMNGARVLQELRARHADLPVIVLSGHVEAGLDLGGATAVIEKPIASAELTRILAALPKPAAAPPGPDPTG